MIEWIKLNKSLDQGAPPRHVVMSRALGCAVHEQPEPGTRGVYSSNKLFPTLHFSQLENKEQSLVPCFARQNHYFALILKSGSVSQRHPTVGQEEVLRRHES